MLCSLQDVHWSKAQSPIGERKVMNLEKLSDVAVLKELRKCDPHSQSDGSITKPHKYQMSKKRRKHVTGTPVAKHDEEEDWVEEMDREAKKVTSVVSPKVCKSGPLISERLSVENKAKLSQLTRADFVTIAELTH